VRESVRGASRLLKGTSRVDGAAELNRAIAFASANSGIRFIVADAHTYGNVPDPQPAFAKASFGLAGALNTPRVHRFSQRVSRCHNQLAAAAELRTHIGAEGDSAGSSRTLYCQRHGYTPLVVGRSYEISVPATAGEALST